MPANELAQSRIAAFRRLDNSLSACSPMRSTVWNVGYTHIRCSCYSSRKNSVEKHRIISIPRANCTEMFPSHPEIRSESPTIR
jgi:hypothetical protein